MHAVIDLLSQEEFVRWVQNPDKELDAFWKQWMVAHPDRIADVKMARELLMGLSADAMTPPTQELKQEILLKVLQEDKKTSSVLIRLEPHLQREPFNWGIFSQFQRVVAILIFGFFLSFLYTVNNPRPEEAIEESVPMEWVSKQTHKGEKLKVTLPDKSEVWLNASTEISYPVSFDGKERLVRLNGEAFFEVHSDSIQPFVVESSGLLTKALGTSFTVTNDIKNKKTKVSLVTGKVHITHQVAQCDELLIPGQQLIFNDKNQQTQVGSYDWKKEIGWKEGWLVFRKASFQEVVELLENWYGIQINTVNQPTRKWDYSGEYQRQTLENILASMAFIEQFTFTIEDKQVTIKF